MTCAPKPHKRSTSHHRGWCLLTHRNPILDRVMLRMNKMAENSRSICYPWFRSATNPPNHALAPDVGVVADLGSVYDQRTLANYDITFNGALVVDDHSFHQLGARANKGIVANVHSLR